ncbi:MAG: galactose-1-phosphate uridylyltransferase [Candidatus Eremiobacteraeota bacterium]|nr:galactose-1-phosphate uridylyltransferase [Candidatus Eremiobacteraeota bacterium]
MPELRQNLATKEWVIIATERAKRPEDFKKEKKEKKERPEYSPTCPFCPGNEKMAPAPVCEVLDNTGNWKIRVVPNKYAAVIPEGSTQRLIQGVVRKMDGVGHHEVIIETPVHNQCTALLPASQVEEILKVYRLRYREIEKDSKVAQVIIFKNHGENAGTSLVHPHSQLVATPVVPSQIRHHIEEAMIFYDDTGECVYCTMLYDELKAKERIVQESEHFAVIVPYAAYSPFYIWIIPKIHRASFSQVSDEELADLARVLKSTLEKLYYGLGDPDFNYVIRGAPGEMSSAGYLHWHIVIVPRLTKTAGFELGSGMFINVSLPEENARFLREIEV